MPLPSLKCIWMEQNAFSAPDFKHVADEPKTKSAAVILS